MHADRFDALLASLPGAPSRRAALRVLAGLGLAGLVSQTDAKKHSKKHKKKKCAKAGQRPGKKRKRCCAGLAPDSSGVCRNPTSSPPPGCTPATCAPPACGIRQDGCGGTLNCGCPVNQICLRSGVCQPCTVTCTGTQRACGDILKQALLAGGTVYVCPGRYQGGFALNKAATVIGAGDGNDAASNTILDANDLGRVLDIGTGVGLVELERLRLTDGRTTGGGIVAGGGILHQGTTLRMTECTVSGNSCVDCLGGGVSSGGTLDMTRCTVRDNHAGGFPGGGGGIYAIGTTTLTDCLIEDNRAEGDGGGLDISINAGTATLAGSTQVRDNAADFGGGILLQLGTLVIAETCRVTENTASQDQGGGIRNVGGTVTLQGAEPSAIVVNNCHENCVGNVPNCTETSLSCPP